MDRLIAQRKTVYLLTLDEGARAAESTNIDGLHILDQLATLGISIGYRVPRVADGVQDRQDGPFLSPHRSARESMSSSTRETEDRRDTVDRTDQEEKAEKEITRSLLLRPKFSGLKGESWRAYKMEWESYIQISGLRKCSEEFQKLALFNMLSGPALQRAQILKPTSEKFLECEGHEPYLALISELFNPSKERSLLRTEFKKRSQRRGESVADFWATKLALFYESYHDFNLPFIILLESTLEGLTSDHVKKAITESSQKNEEELQACILKSVSDSAVLYSLGVQGYGSNTRLSRDMENLQAISDRKEFRERGRGRTRGGGSSDPRRPQRDLSEVVCWACDKKGHYSQDCRSKGQKSGGKPSQGSKGGRGGPSNRRSRGNRPGRGRGRGRNQQGVRAVGQEDSEQEDQQPTQHPDDQWGSFWGESDQD